MKILHLDENHPVLIDKLNELGFENDKAYQENKHQLEAIISRYEGIVIRSRIPIDRDFIDKAASLKFIARVGAGLENIDVEYAHSKNIQLFSAPEGNRNAVGEHTLGMVLSLFNHLNQANQQVREGKWLREQNRGYELDYKTVGIIGYGNMGKAFARKLRGFDVEVICYDIKDDVENSDATQVSLDELFEKTDVLSLHTPLTGLTDRMINKDFIYSFKKPFWFINTARGKSAVTKDLVEALKDKKILGAGLDVLEYEKASFEDLFTSEREMPSELKELIKMPNVLLSPHVAGWTIESKQKLAKTLTDKIQKAFIK